MTMSSSTSSTDLLPSDLEEKINMMIKKYPETGALFEEMISIIKESRGGNNSLNHKKVKTELTSVSHLGKDLIDCSEISFQMPIRKKARITFYEKGLSIISANDVVEVALKYSNILKILVVPTPGKMKPHYTWIIIPTSMENSDICVLPPDTVIMNFDDYIQNFAVDSNLEINGSSVNELMTCCFKTAFPAGQICVTDPKLFSSTDTVDYSKKGVPYITAYARAKEGYMYFFKFGILFGFKKPVMFYPIERVKSFEISGVTGRFFNIQIQLKDSDVIDIIEYSMIPMPEHRGITEYIAKTFGQNRMRRENAALSAPKAFIAVPLAPSDEEDDDYAQPDSQGVVAEEYDSDHETDTESSVSIDSEEGGQDGVEEGGEQDEKPMTLAQTQLLAIEKQRKNRIPSGKGTIAAPIEIDEEDLDVASSGSESDEDENEYESDVDELE